uniref:Uncharacterized protein n=1 Tax=Branchiostoma floridae TaxID=7739 RepID=C3Y859_BRAFL|eukprot:XP_002607518.1 hypothetical protein BRAFLDRAFT_69949 [Branchiostoma floridae]
MGWATVETVEEGTGKQTQMTMTRSDEEMFHFLTPHRIKAYVRRVTRGVEDPPGIQLYVAVKEVVLNGGRLSKYRCRQGSNSLEGLHSHLYNAVPSQRCEIMPFQVYLISFAVQWNNQMDFPRVAGRQGRQTTCIDARQVQLMNLQAEVLFGKEHLLEPNFVAPLPYPDKYDSPEEELLGIEYAMCQSTDFTAVRYYAEKDKVLGYNTHR